jgi:hypothetical protein
VLQRHSKQLSRDEDLKTFLGSSESIKVQAVPLFPSSPIVIKLKHPVTLSPHSTSQWWIPLPLDIGFQFAEHSVDPNLRMPIRRLSHTWFGTPTDGIRALSLPCAYLNDIESPPQSDEFLCSLSLLNQWKKWIVVDRIVVMTEYLHLYDQKTRFVSDGLSYLYRGKPNQCKIDFHGTPFVVGQQKICEPQKPLEFHAVHSCISEVML